MKKNQSGIRQAGEAASELISQRIADLDDWRGETLGEVRALIKEVDPDILEEWMWRGTPVWSHDGIVCTGETYKNAVKMTFAKGAALKDPKGLFNSSLGGNVRRAIDIHEGEKIDTAALKALLREAVALNVAGKKAPPAKRAAATSSAPPKKAAPAKRAAAAKPSAPPKKAPPAKRAAAKPDVAAKKAAPARRAAR